MSHARKSVRGTVAAALVALIAALGAAAPAQAGDTVFYEGLVWQNGLYTNDVLFINKVGVRSLSGDQVCANAVHQTSPSVVGVDICSFSLAEHPFCGCVARRPYMAAGPSSAVANARGRVHWP